MQKRSLESNPVIPKVWSLVHQCYHLDKECRFSGPSPDLLNQKSEILWEGLAVQVVLIAAEVSKPLIHSVPLELEYYFSKIFWSVLEILFLLLLDKAFFPTQFFRINNKKETQYLSFVFQVCWLGSTCVGQGGGSVEGEHRGFFR